MTIVTAKKYLHISNHNTKLGNIQNQQILLLLDMHTLCTDNSR